MKLWKVSFVLSPPFQKKEGCAHVPDTSRICPGYPGWLSIGYLRLSAEQNLGIPGNRVCLCVCLFVVINPEHPYFASRSGLEAKPVGVYPLGPRSSSCGPTKGTPPPSRTGWTNLSARTKKSVTRPSNSRNPLEHVRSARFYTHLWQNQNRGEGHFKTSLFKSVVVAKRDIVVKWRMLLLLRIKKWCSIFVWNSQGAVFYSHRSEWLWIADCRYIFFFFFGVFLFLCVRVCVNLYMYVRAYLAIPCVSANDNVKHIKSNIRYDNKINTRNKFEIHKNSCIYMYTEWMFASNLAHRDRKPKYISKFWTKHGGDGKQWPLTPFPFLAPWPSRRPAIETPPRPVPAGPLISWPKNASCSRIPPRASQTSLPPRRWVMTRHRLSLRPCTAPLSCSLQPLLKLSLLSLRPSLLQFVSIDSPLLNYGNPIFELVCVFLPFPLLPLLFW